MNTEFEQALQHVYSHTHGHKTAWEIIRKNIDELENKANPHLLNEGEKEQPKLTQHDFKKLSFYENTLIVVKSNTDGTIIPTDPVGNDWGKVAERMFEKYSDYGTQDGKWFIDKDTLKAALTEALQQGYEKGSKEAEGWYEKYGNAITEIAELQQQLAEKEERIDELIIAGLSSTHKVADLRAELAAAKEKIEKLERDNKAHISINAQLSEYINYLNEKIQKLESYPCTCSSDIERLGCKEMCDFNKSLKTKT